MNRTETKTGRNIGRRAVAAAATLAVAGVTALGIGGPAHAGEPIMSWKGEATILLDNSDAQWFALYDFFHTNQVCTSISNSVNATRQAQGQTVMLPVSTCVSALIYCVQQKHTNVQIYFDADNRFVCSQYTVG
jgi:hypothetical protein